MNTSFDFEKFALLKIKKVLYFSLLNLKRSNFKGKENKSHMRRRFRGEKSKFAALLNKKNELSNLI